MGFGASLAQAAQEALPGLLAPPVMLIPFIIAEQIRPVGARPGWRDYGFNLLILMSTLYLVLPAGVAAGMASGVIRAHLPWHPFSLSYDSLATIPVIGSFLRIPAMIVVPLVLHDMWFYWAHRIEHRVSFLWEFHKLHHSDEQMNCSTFGRDHFLQAAWIALFPAFTLGLIFDIDAAQAGEAAVWSGLFLALLSMFYHSAIRVRLPWFDRILVTPQVHRIHHSRDPAHHNRNFADVFPLFDILFGTYRRPLRDDFGPTGLGEGAPRTLWQAQAAPAWRGLRRLMGRA